MEVVEVEIGDGEDLREDKDEQRTDVEDVEECRLVWVDECWEGSARRGVGGRVLHVRGLAVSTAGEGRAPWPARGTRGSTRRDGRARSRQTHLAA